MIKISELQPIQTAEKFFSTDRILMVDIVQAPSIAAIRAQIAQHRNSFYHAGQLYLIVCFAGAPQNLILNARKGVPLRLGGTTHLIAWQGDLMTAMRGKQIYELTGYDHVKNSDIMLTLEPELFVERFLLNGTPYSEKVQVGVRL